MLLLRVMAFFGQRSSWTVLRHLLCRLEDFFSLLLAGRGMNAVASGVTIAVQLLASASMGLIVPV